MLCLQTVRFTFTGPFSLLQVGYQEFDALLCSGGGSTVTDSSSSSTAAPAVEAGTSGAGAGGGAGAAATGDAQ